MEFDLVFTIVDSPSKAPASVCDPYFVSHLQAQCFLDQLSFPPTPFSSTSIDMRLWFVDKVVYSRGFTIGRLKRHFVAHLSEYLDDLFG